MYVFYYCAAIEPGQRVGRATDSDSKWEAMGLSS